MKTVLYALFLSTLVTATGCATMPKPMVAPSTVGTCGDLPQEEYDLFRSVHRMAENLAARIEATGWKPRSPSFDNDNIMFTHMAQQGVLLMSYCGIMQRIITPWGEWELGVALSLDTSTASPAAWDLIMPTNAIYQEIGKHRPSDVGHCDKLIKYEIASVEGHAIAPFKLRTTPVSIPEEVEGERRWKMLHACYHRDEASPTR